MCKPIIYYDPYLAEIDFWTAKCSFDLTELSYVLDTVETASINSLDERSM